jgi:hypothetical protein
MRTEAYSEAAWAMNNRFGYFKFDLTGYTAETLESLVVSIWMNPNAGNNTFGNAGTILGLFGTTHTSPTQQNITWNTRGNAHSLTTPTAVSRPMTNVAGFYDFDVTAWAKARLAAGATEIAFIFRTFTVTDPAVSPPGNDWSTHAHFLAAAEATRPRATAVLNAELDDPGNGPEPVDLPDPVVQVATTQLWLRNGALPTPPADGSGAERALNGATFTLEQNNNGVDSRHSRTYFMYDLPELPELPEGYRWQVTANLTMTNAPPTPPLPNVTGMNVLRVPYEWDANALTYPNQDELMPSLFRANDGGAGGASIPSYRPFAPAFFVGGRLLPSTEVPQAINFDVTNFIMARINAGETVASLVFTPHLRNVGGLAPDGWRVGTGVMTFAGITNGNVAARPSLTFTAVPGIAPTAAMGIEADLPLCDVCAALVWECVCELPLCAYESEPAKCEDDEDYTLGDNPEE